MVLPFLSRWISENRRRPIVPYSYTHNADNRGADNFSKGGIQNGISSLAMRIVFRKEDTSED